MEYWVFAPTLQYSITPALQFFSSILRLVELFDEAAGFDFSQDTFVNELFDISAARLRFGCGDEFERSFHRLGCSIERGVVIFRRQKIVGRFKIFDVFFLSRLNAQFFLQHFETLFLVFFEISNAFDQTFGEADGLGPDWLLSNYA